MKNVFYLIGTELESELVKTAAKNVYTRPVKTSLFKHQFFILQALHIFHAAVQYNTIQVFYQYYTLIYPLLTASHAYTTVVAALLVMVMLQSWPCC